VALQRRQIIVAVVLALAVGAAVSWLTRSPTRSTDAVKRPLPAGEHRPNPAPETRTIYKWQDANGVWNFSDLPPLDRPYALVIGTPNVTSVPTVVPESAEPSSTTKPVAPKR